MDVITSELLTAVRRMVDMGLEAVTAEDVAHHHPELGDAETVGARLHKLSEDGLLDRVPGESHFDGRGHEGEWIDMYFPTEAARDLLKSERASAWDVPQFAEDRQRIEDWFAANPDAESAVFGLVNDDAAMTVTIYRDGAVTFSESHEGYETVVAPWYFQ